eukprot:TRINITY_DN8260_c0_g1_i2.p1 TRINITY_DN8260_c0_g1~~TRINITY_DN8260_c0_g1_i2.p1  ORF type:complete len:401 (-),score=79.79 TRINITY_DN8260_c0_g1_i2:37-1239(-)
MRRNSAFGERLEQLKRHGKEIIDNGRRLSVVRESEKIKVLIQAKRKQLMDELGKPPFVRIIDRLAFVFGLLVMCVTEYFLLRAPQLMYLWYTALIFPLMAIRFFMYHKIKFHYFMLDFCYFCQFMLLFYLFGFGSLLEGERKVNLFKVVFAMSTGPLAWGTVVWRNSLVFHDMDKLTSVFIHLCPPLVTFCLRWYPLHGDLTTACGGGPCTLGFNDTIMMPMYLYMFWQVAYYLKTELIDRKKLQSDQEIMTSSRWMSERHPHPIYKWARKRGYKWSPKGLLMIVQIVYTILSMAPLPLFINNYLLHCGFLLAIFVNLLWNGASYYFEVFSESYSKRIEALRKEAKEEEVAASEAGQAAKDGQEASEKKHQLRRIQSIRTSLFFFAGFLVALYYFLMLIL